MQLTATTQNGLFDDDEQLAYTIRTESFEGPLDLLLHLIRKNEVDIYNIPIAVITRQYLDYIELMRELNLDIAGEFIVMASTLIQIKSRMLLPAVPDDEVDEAEVEDPRAELVRRLLEYQKYREAALALGDRELLGRELFARTFASPELVPLQPAEETLEVELFELMEAFRGLLAKVPATSFHEVGVEGISIADRINEIVELLQLRRTVAFDALFPEQLTREYIIATFLAMLELCKLRMVKVYQAHGFGTIWITSALLSDNDETQGGEGHARIEP